MPGAPLRRLEGAELGERVSGSGSGRAGPGRQGSPPAAGRGFERAGVWGVRCPSPVRPAAPREPGNQAPREPFTRTAGLEPARMNRKKGDKGFESPRPYKL